ncbi:MAG: hypothetical protein GY936_20550 [Ignavibacteriae bacterium]|nr:hypothetical protein [Ignavibacteriota bacterium]
MTLLVNVFQLLIMLSIFSPSNDGMFPEIEGYQKNGEIETYNPDNLYDIINGAADSYIKYDFEKLSIIRYKGNADQSLRIEIYRHSNSANAFGIYSNERPLKGNWIDVGAQGYYENKILNFYKGKYYMKLMSYKIDNSEELLLSVAKKVAENLEGKDELPKLLESFPTDGKINYSGRYIHKNFLGYKSLSEAFTMDYVVDGKNFKMFIIQKSNVDACKKMLEDYFVSIKVDGNNIQEGSLKVKDEYQGDISILWKANNVIGILNSSDIELSDKYLKSMCEKLQMD